MRSDTSAAGLSLDADQIDRLLRYVDLLGRWNATYNLTGARDAETIWSRHVLDCLAAVPSVRARLHPATTARILDVGSGGGLPGIPWAIAMPGTDVHCIDAVAKKAAFVRQAAAVLGLPNVHGLHGRVEKLAEAPFDLITSRAFSSLADLLALTRPLLAGEGRWVALKGREPAEEIEATGWPLTLFHVEPLVVPGLAEQRCLVWIERPDATGRAQADPPA